jgi:hypothetical protein
MGSAIYDGDVPARHQLRDGQAARGATVAHFNWARMGGDGSPGGNRGGCDATRLVGLLTPNAEPKNV